VPVRLPRKYVVVARYATYQWSSVVISSHSVLLTPHRLSFLITIFLHKDCPSPKSPLNSIQQSICTLKVSPGSSSPPSSSLSNLRPTSRTTLLPALPRAGHPTRQIKITCSHTSTRSRTTTRRCLNGTVHAGERAVFLLILEFGFEFWIDWLRGRRKLAVLV
jgi:hypothetical protein